jgi:hypothetical protein
VALCPALCTRGKTAFQKFRNELREFAILARRSNLDAAHHSVRNIERRLHHPEFQKNGFLSIILGGQRKREPDYSRPLQLRLLSVFEHFVGTKCYFHLLQR